MIIITIIGSWRAAGCAWKAPRMTRSSGKSACQGKPHIGSSETEDASCWLAVPTAPDSDCLNMMMMMMMMTTIIR